MLGVTTNVKNETAELVDHHIEAMAAVVLASSPQDPFTEDPFNSILHFDQGSFRGAIYDNDENIEEATGNVVLIAIEEADGTFSYQDSNYWNTTYKQRVLENPIINIGHTLSQSPKPADQPTARWEIRYYKKGGRSVYLAINQHENKDEYLELIVLTAMAIPLAAVILALGGWWMGFYAVRPVKAMSLAVSSIKAEDLDKRVPQSEREDEMGELASLINAMLDRIEKSYNQAKRFTADASHELRTPLAILQGELEARMRDSNHELESNARMLDEIRRLKALTHSLLFLSKADSGSLKIDHEPIDLRNITNQSMTDMEEISRDKKLSFTFDDQLGETSITGDPSLIQQALMNLIKNAIKFNRPNGKVSCSLHNKTTAIHIRIGNTGQEIPTIDHERIFERFYRIDDDRNRQTGGFGLGLNIAREIVRAHGGDLILLSSTSDWSEFEITLPLSAQT